MSGCWAEAGRCASESRGGWGPREGLEVVGAVSYELGSIDLILPGKANPTDATIYMNWVTPIYSENSPGCQEQVSHKRYSS